MNVRSKLVEELAPMEPLSFRACQSKSPWQRLMAWVHFERRDLWVLFAYAAAVGVFSLATPLAVQSLFNTVAFGQLIQPLFVLALIVFVALGVSAFMNALQLLIVEHVGRRVFLRTAMDFGARLPLVRSRLNGKDLDELSNRFLDVVVVEKSMSQIVLDGLSATLQITVGLLLLAVYHPYLLAFDAVLIVSVLFVIFVLGQRAISTAIKESKGKYAIFAWLQDVAKNSHSFRSVRGGEYVGLRTSGLANDWLDARKRHWRVQFRQQIAMLSLQVVATTLLLALGGWLVLERQLSLGQLVAAELMITLTVGSLAKLGKLLPKLYDLIAGLDKIGNVLDLDAPSLEGDTLSVGPKGLALQLNVNDFGLHLDRGEKRVVCATENPNALAAIEGIGSPWSSHRGAVRIERVDAQDLAIDSLHQDVLILRNNGLFPGSIRDNLSLGDRTIDRADMRDALDSAGIFQKVEALADGIDTPLNRAGQPLAPADQARLLFARALVLQPRLLVVDRVFDSLGETERHAIVDHLFSPTRPWTVLYLTAHGSDSHSGSNARPLTEVVA